jgi:hypothetical protein
MDSMRAQVCHRCDQFLSVSTLLACLLAPLAVRTVALAEGNGATRFPLHAVEEQLGTCVIGDPCDPRDANVCVARGEEVTVYVLVRDYDSISGAQTAFEWDDWTLLYGIWSDCQSNQITLHSPHGSGGPTEGTLSTVFDGIIGGQTAVLGYMHFIAGTGCVSQIPSALPFGTHVFDAQGQVSILAVRPREDFGKVCVTGWAYDGCSAMLPFDSSAAREDSCIALNPVLEDTWGHLKSTYY